MTQDSPDWPWWLLAIVACAVALVACWFGAGQ